MMIKKRFVLSTKRLSNKKRFKLIEFDDTYFFWKFDRNSMKRKMMKTTSYKISLTPLKDSHLIGSEKLMNH